MSEHRYDPERPAEPMAPAPPELGPPTMGDHDDEQRRAAAYAPVAGELPTDQGRPVYPADQAALEEWRERMDRLREQADREYPAPWMPEPGDELIGTLVGVKPSVPTAFGPAAVAELETPSGERVSVWLMSTVLRRQFEREDVHVGELVLIRYVGKVRPDGGGNPYHDYRLVVDRPIGEHAVDWRSIATRYADDLEGPPVPEPRPTPTEFPTSPVDEDIPF